MAVGSFVSYVCTLASEVFSYRFTTGETSLTDQTAQNLSDREALITECILRDAMRLANIFSLEYDVTVKGK